MHCGTCVSSALWREREETDLQLAWMDEAAAEWCSHSQPGPCLWGDWCKIIIIITKTGVCSEQAVRPGSCFCCRCCSCSWWIKLQVASKWRRPGVQPYGGPGLARIFRTGPLIEWGPAVRRTTACTNISHQLSFPRHHGATWHQVCNTALCVCVSKHAHLSPFVPRFGLVCFISPPPRAMLKGVIIWWLISIACDE